MKMKPFTILLLCGLAAAACTLEELPYVEGTDPSAAEEAATVDCSDFNADIAVLQVLGAELLSGSCILSVDGTSLVFDSGTTVSVPVREAYAFSCVNPSVGISGRYWVIGGSVLGTRVADAVLQFKCEEGSWYYSLDGGSAWTCWGDAEAGTSVPVFTALADSGTEVVVSLGSGIHFSFDYYEDDED